VFEYDHGYVYLPERSPDPLPPEACRPLGRWWVGATLELAWVPTQPAPANVRLRVPGPAGLTLPGVILPTRGLATSEFEAAFGLTLGAWFDPLNTHGVDSSFFVRNSDTTFSAYAPGSVVLFADGPGRSPPRVISLGEPLASNFVATFPATLSTFFTTVDVNYRHRLFCSPNARLDWLAGYRFAYLSDELYLGEVPDGNDYRRNRLAVTNPFHAGQVGLAGEMRGDRWYISSSAKLAFGVVTPEVTASGLFLNAESGTAGRGYQRVAALAVPTQSEFAVMPVFNAALGRQMTDHARAFVGYTFQYLSTVGRLSDTLHPDSHGLCLTDFWVQSINFGLELRY
jgi:Putative beta barrel porin-7 (BBP7)